MNTMSQLLGVKNATCDLFSCANVRFQLVSIGFLEPLRFNFHFDQVWWDNRKRQKEKKRYRAVYPDTKVGHAVRQMKWLPSVDMEKNQQQQKTCPIAKSSDLIIQFI